MTTAVKCHRPPPCRRGWAGGRPRAGRGQARWTRVPSFVVSTTQPSPCSAAAQGVGDGEVLARPGPRRGRRPAPATSSGTSSSARSTRPDRRAHRPAPRRRAARRRRGRRRRARRWRAVTVSKTTAMAPGRVEVVVHPGREGRRARRRRARRRASVGRAAGEGVEPAERAGRGLESVARRPGPASGSGPAAAPCGRRGGSTCSMRSSRFVEVAELFDIFSPSASTTKAWCIQWLAKRLPSATAWARSFSWCGNLRSSPPQWRSKPSPSRSSDITTHSVCQPGRPVAPRRRPRRLAGLGQLPQREVGRVALVLGAVRPRARRRRPACRRGTGGRAARSPRPRRRRGTRRRR